MEKQVLPPFLDCREGLSAPTSVFCPRQFVAMVPYVATLLVVAGAIGRVRFPKGLGVPYLRE
jgi:ABC-type uncharacterized transport system permease subunit|tara:strand:+ start:649 stop:834 length:186 start_codon:yes stop_codon:yes gene_type:complete